MKSLIILLLVSNFVFSQNIDDVKKKDTIYISYKNGKGLKKNIYSTNYRDYRFNLKMKENEYLLFEKPDYNPLSENGKSFLARNENKSFLKKNKKNIIDIGFLKQFKADYIACELLSRKVLYIIDFTESKRKDVILYKVYLVYNCPVYE